MHQYNGGKLVFHFLRHYIAPGSGSSHYQHQNMACPKVEFFCKGKSAFMLWFELGTGKFKQYHGFWYNQGIFLHCLLSDISLNIYLFGYVKCQITLSCQEL